MQPLPIDEHIPAILTAVRERGAAVVVAAPGAGKTTRVGPALCQLGRTILLQPRRVAARALARRIAVERGWTLGGEVGWQVRMDRRFTARTQLLVATEGILTARLQADPLIEDFRVVAIDEFHERSVHGDVALALARQAALARKDLGIVVLSATLDADRVADFLGGCPIIRATGTLHPVSVSYAEGLDLAAAVARVAADASGHILCFLPGAGEIRRAQRAVERALPGRRVVPLHGSLDADAQDAAIAPDTGGTIILATNVAETSLTIDGVSDVVDTGLQKVLRYEAGHGVDRLQTERIAADSTAQRSGRAGRTGPGRTLRLWDARERLREHREPEIRRIDVAGPVMDVIAWGGDPRTFAWFERPPDDGLEAALFLLRRLGAIGDETAPRLTPLGERMRELPLHPRLARLLVEMRGSRLGALACAVLSERLPPRSSDVATDDDLLAAIDAATPATRATASALEAAARGLRLEPETASAEDEPTRLRRALLAAFADRVARRRAPGSPRLVLASGHGAVLTRDSGVHEGELLVALDVVAGDRGPGSEAQVRAACRVEPAWVAPNATDVEHRFDAEASTVRAVRRQLYDALVLSEHPVAPDPSRAADLLAAVLQARPLGSDAEAVLARLRFAGLRHDRESILRDACAGHVSVPRLDLLATLPPATRHALDTLAPATMPVPSGRSVPLEYRADGSVAASVKLQELFGLAETPRVGPRREPVLLQLLAPNGRPVQSTRDLGSFWTRTYPEVRRELRGRYPRHPWPEDPWTAEPTHRTRRR